MNTSEAGIEHIKAFEALRLRAYKPHPQDKWTIGYGHTSGVAQGDVLADEAEAITLLMDDLAWAEAVVKQHVTVPLDQSQFDALVSFVFNIGEKQFVGSTLLEVLNKGEYRKVDYQLSRWIYSSGKVFDGLIRRRRAEAEMFTDRAPRFTKKGIMPQTVYVEQAPKVAETIKKSRTAKGGVGVASAGGLQFMNELSGQISGIGANLSGVLEPTLLIPVVVAGVGVYVVYRKWADQRDGRAY